MNRRSFLGAVPAALLLARGLARTDASQHIDKLGAQLYTVRRQLQMDFDRTLSKVAAIGYREVELGSYFGRDPKQVRASLDLAGLVAPSGHFDYGDLGDKWPAILEGAKVIGHEYVVCPWIDEKLRRQPDIWQRAAATFNRAGELARKAGLQFAYHNHAFEFEPVNGRLPYDVLLSEMDPDLVKLELDLFWIEKGGADPVAYFRKYPGRFPMVHLKGRDARGEMAPVAPSNTIDWKSVLSRSHEAGIRHYFVEHDNPPDPFDSLQQSYHYLHDLRF